MPKPDIKDLQSLTLQEFAKKFPSAWNDFLDMVRLAEDHSITNQWFLYVMGFHTGRIHACNSLSKETQE